MFALGRAFERKILTPLFRGYSNQNCYDFSNYAVKYNMKSQKVFHTSSPSLVAALTKDGFFFSPEQRHE